MNLKPIRLTKRQKEAYRRLIMRDGWKNLTAEDAKLLSTCKFLCYSQREQMAVIAQGK